MYYSIMSNHPGVVRHYVAASDAQGLVWIKSREAALRFTGFELAKAWLKSLKHSGIGTTIIQIGDRLTL